ncbi:TetR family transcriptional regulator [Streptomyces sp. NPDC059455]|uniref:TetR family transcriptional regulator n=1 Tax=Streptomyces sp. NPDC059455 TaxID=3346837 RepID=UPI0036A66A23
MSEAQAQGRGAGGSAKPSKREALIAAAFDLFTKHGFEQTTVDDIVRLAGVGRSSFFRYFPSKEDVVFPDHEGCLAEMTAFLQDGSGEEDPVIRVCDAARLVMRMYSGNPSFAVQRYRLTKSVPGLRHHELSVVWRYERTLADYLRRRFVHRPDGTLRADVIAASLVAAHNNALRAWLRSGGQDDPTAHMDHALRFVLNSWGPEGEARSTDEEDADDVVVLIAKRTAPMWRVVRGIETTLGDP